MHNTPPPPRAVDWAEAPERILTLAEQRREGRPVVIVGVCGPVGAGKTTLAARLGSCVIATDSYLPDYDPVDHSQRDEPESADLARLAADLASLRAGRETFIPSWSFRTHRREGERTVLPAPIVVCEGIHALHASVREAMHVLVFVEAARTTRWSRWEAIERAGLRAMGVQRAREHFDLVAEPTFARFAADYRACADFLVSNDGH